jgi:hypothetical protein
VILGKDAWTRAVAAAARAPSPHNAQPSRWRLRGSRVELYGDPAGWLSAGDASGRDDLISFGMAWEAMSIALSGEGGCLLQPSPAGLQSAVHPHVGLIAAADLEGGTAVDVLAPAGQTPPFRGSSPPADAAARLDACISAHTDIAAPIAEAARPHGPLATTRRRPDCATQARARAYQWMRFSRRDPRWSRRSRCHCLMLNGLEAWGASG